MWLCIMPLHHECVFVLPSLYVSIFRLFTVLVLNLVILHNMIQPIMSLSFVGKSENLVATSRGAKSQLSVWSMSQLTASWSYMLQIEGESLLSFVPKAKLLALSCYFSSLSLLDDGNWKTMVVRLLTASYLFK